jgi:uncharacterized protein YbcI
MPGTNPELVGRGAQTAAISNAMVGLLHRYTGRGPTRARTTVGTDVIVCVMGATLTRGEQSLAQDGKADVVLHSRRAFQDTMQAEAISAVQEISGRQVIAFMSNNHINPDLAVEVFILEPQPIDPLQDGHPFRDGNPFQDGHPLRDGKPYHDGNPMHDGKPQHDGNPMHDGQPHDDQQ